MVERGGNSERKSGTGFQLDGHEEGVWKNLCGSTDEIGVGIVIKYFKIQKYAV